MVTNRAFWFRSEAGKYEVISLIKGETHIQKVIDNPVLFGETDKSISESYTKYNEHPGWEGKARGEILVRLKSRGWLRSRFHKSQSRWIIDIDDFYLRTKLISEFITYILNLKYLALDIDEIHIFDDKEFHGIIKSRAEISVFINPVIHRTNKNNKK